MFEHDGKKPKEDGRLHLKKAGLQLNRTDYEILAKKNDNGMKVPLPENSPHFATCLRVPRRTPTPFQ